MKITHEALCEMMDYRSRSHYLARKLSPERLAKLTPAERAERTLAQKRLSKVRSRAKPLFAIHAVQPPTRMDSWRDYLFSPKGRDIIRP